MAIKGEITIQPNELQESIQSILYELPEKCDNAITRAAQTVSKDAVKELKKTSPRGRTGRYAKGWSTKRIGNKMVIHNRTDYQLTHLLENGHDIVRNGKKVGRYKGIRHIKDVEVKVQKDMAEEVEKELDKL